MKLHELLAENILDDNEMLEMMKKLLKSKGFSVYDTSFYGRPAIAIAGLPGTARTVRVRLDPKTGNWEAQALSGQGHKVDLAAKGSEEDILGYLNYHSYDIAAGKKTK